MTGSRFRETSPPLAGIMADATRKEGVHTPWARAGSGARSAHGEADRRRGGRSALRIVMRFVMPMLMLGFAAYTVVTGGLHGLVVLLPILVAHIVGFLVIYPLWILYRRRRRARTSA